MRILVLGASGLIGHKLFQTLSKRFSDVIPGLHGDPQRFSEYGIFTDRDAIRFLDVFDFHETDAVLEEIKPDIILNCAGITKRRSELSEPIRAIKINALFPHHLAAWAKVHNARVIHFSTDCVFDGSRGGYTEADPTTASDTYGKTKALGEIRYRHTLTVRSSFIGRELCDHSELLDWFLSQSGRSITGYRNVHYTGVSTLELARVVGDLIEHRPDLNGLYQLSVDEPISKFDLLVLARECFDIDVDIIPDDKTYGRATLNSSSFREATKFTVPTWPEMMAGIKADPTPYKRLS